MCTCSSSCSDERRRCARPGPSRGDRSRRAPLGRWMMCFGAWASRTGPRYPGIPSVLAEPPAGADALNPGLLALGRRLHGVAGACWKGRRFGREALDFSFGRRRRAARRVQGRSSQIAEGRFAPEKRTEVCENHAGTFFTTLESAAFLTATCKRMCVSRCCCGVDAAARRMARFDSQHRRRPAPSTSSRGRTSRGSKPWACAPTSTSGIGSVLMWTYRGVRPCRVSNYCLQRHPGGGQQVVFDETCPQRRNSSDCARAGAAEFEAELIDDATVAGAALTIFVAYEKLPTPARAATCASARSCLGRCRAGHRHICPPGRQSPARVCVQVGGPTGKDGARPRYSRLRRFSNLAVFAVFRPQADGTETREATGGRGHRDDVVLPTGRGAHPVVVAACRPGARVAEGGRSDWR